MEIYLRLRGFTATDISRQSEVLIAVLDNHIDHQVEEHIKLALQNGQRVLLVVNERLKLNEVDLNLEGLEVVRWVHDYQKAGIDKIEKFITYNQDDDYNACLRTRSLSVDSGIDVCA